MEEAEVAAVAEAVVVAIAGNYCEDKEEEVVAVVVAAAVVEVEEVWSSCTREVFQCPSCRWPAVREAKEEVAAEARAVEEAEGCLVAPTLQQEPLTLHSQTGCLAETSSP